MRVPLGLLRPLPRAAVAVLLFAVCTVVWPRWWCGREGERWYSGDVETTLGLARHVAATVAEGVTTENFTSDSALFRNEWQFGSYQMAALGLLQVCREHPELAVEFRPSIEVAVDHLLSPEVRSFDAQQWNADPLSSLEGPAGHAAYLGYLNLVLSLQRAVFPDSRHGELNDNISAALARRFRDSAQHIIETYPDQAYPVDNAAGLASLLLHQRVTGIDHSLAVAPTLQRMRTDWRDPRTGLLMQAIDCRTGQAYDRGRASGTALAAYFLSMGESEISGMLSASVRAHLAGSVLGFGFVDEYAAGDRGGGDIDSGPLIFGMSPSGTGFAIGYSRAFGDRSQYLRLYRTAYLMGAPVSRGNRWSFVTGGPLGNAIMLAMLTAQPAQQ